MYWLKQNNVDLLSKLLFTSTLKQRKIFNLGTESATPLLQREQQHSVHIRVYVVARFFVQNIASKFRHQVSSISPHNGSLEGVN